MDCYLAKRLLKTICRTKTFQALDMHIPALYCHGNTVVRFMLSQSIGQCERRRLPIMAYDLKDKVVFITGAASGVGEGVVRLLVEEGVKMDEYYSRTGVRVLTVCFGATDTALLSTAKAGTFDKELNAQIPEWMKMAYSQKMESAAKGVIAAYKQGASGSTWVAARDELPKDITADVKRAYDILSVHAA